MDEIRAKRLVEAWWANIHSPTARRSYARSLRRFASWALVDGDKPEDVLQLLCSMSYQCARSTASKWMQVLLSEGLSHGTAAGYLSPLVSLTSKAQDEGLIEWCLGKFWTGGPERPANNPPPRSKIEALLDLVDRVAAKGNRLATRDAALIRVMASELSRAEAVGLRLEDYEPAGDAGPVLRPRRKGHKERKAVTVTPRVAAAIDAWLAVRGREAGPLFVRVKGRQSDSPALNGESVRRLLVTWSRRAGLPRAIRPDDLRKSTKRTRKDLGDQFFDDVCDI